MTMSLGINLPQNESIPVRKKCFIFIQFSYFQEEKPYQLGITSLAENKKDPISTVTYRYTKTNRKEVWFHLRAGSRKNLNLAGMHFLLEMRIFLAHLYHSSGC